MGHDARQAVRLLVRRPAFALTVIITLALGVGVNAALFSVVNFLLLKPLPVENPDRLVVVASRHAGDCMSSCDASAGSDASNHTRPRTNRRIPVGARPRAEVRAGRSG